MQKQNQKKFRVEKVIKKKGNKLYVEWKGYDSSFNSWIDKKNIIQMSEYFPKLKSCKKRVKGELDLSNYAKNATSVDTSKFAKIVDLRSLKSGVNKLDIDKLEKGWLKRLEK